MVLCGRGDMEILPGLPYRGGRTPRGTPPCTYLSHPTLARRTGQRLQNGCNTGREHDHRPLRGTFLISKPSPVQIPGDVPGWVYLWVHLWMCTYGPAYGHDLWTTHIRGCDSRIFLWEYWSNIDTQHLTSIQHSFIY